MTLITLDGVSVLLFINKADIFLLPCPIKYLIGIDCPGCGFQRSVLALFSGNLTASLKLYPAAIPFIISSIIGISAWRFKLNENSIWLKALYFFTGFIVLTAYFYKIISHQL